MAVSLVSGSVLMRAQYEKRENDNAQYRLVGREVSNIVAAIDKRVLLDGIEGRTTWDGQWNDTSSVMESFSKELIAKDNPECGAADGWHPNLNENKDVALISCEMNRGIFKGFSLESERVGSGKLLQEWNFTLYSKDERFDKMFNQYQRVLNSAKLADAVRVTGAHDYRLIDRVTKESITSQRCLTLRERCGIQASFKLNKLGIAEDYHLRVNGENSMRNSLTFASNAKPAVCYRYDSSNKKIDTTCGLEYDIASEDLILNSKEVSTGSIHITAENKDDTLSPVFCQDTDSSGRQKKVLCGITAVQSGASVYAESYVNAVKADQYIRLAKQGGSGIAFGVDNKGDLTTAGNANIGKSATINGALVANGTSTLKGDVTAEKNLTVKGSQTTLGNTTTNGNALVKGALTAEKDARVKGKLTVDNDAILNRMLTVARDGHFKGALDVDGASNVDGNTTLKGTLNVAKDSSLAGNLVVDKSARVKGNLTVDSNIHTRGTMTVERDVIAKSNMIVEKRFQAKGGVDIFGDGSITGNLTVGRNTNLNGSLTAKQGRFLEQVFMDKGATVTGNVTASGDVKGRNVTATNDLVASNEVRAGKILRTPRSENSLTYTDRLFMKQFKSVGQSCYAGEVAVTSSGHMLNCVSGKFVARTAAASTSSAGTVSLSNSVTSTSTTVAATSRAVKTAYDKALEAKKQADNALKAPKGMKWVKVAGSDGQGMTIGNGKRGTITFKGLGISSWIHGKYQYRIEFRTSNVNANANTGEWGFWATNCREITTFMKGPFLRCDVYGHAAGSARGSLSKIAVFQLK